MGIEENVPNLQVACPPVLTQLSLCTFCVLMVFVCAWTSVHPNVPPHLLMGGLLARVKLMFWVIVAPELVLPWCDSGSLQGRSETNTWDTVFYTIDDGWLQTQGDDTVAMQVVCTLHYNLTHLIGTKGGPLDSMVKNESSSRIGSSSASLFLLVLRLMLVLLSLLFITFFLDSFTFTATFEIVKTNKVPPGATHVPSFYALRTKSDRIIVFAIFDVGEKAVAQFLTAARRK